MGSYRSTASRRYWIQYISKLQHYKGQYNWNGLEFPLAIQKIDNFEMKNPDIAVSVNTARKLELNGKCSKQGNLLMIVGGGRGITQ